MAKISTLSEMRDYVKRSLGAPINCVEIDNAQIDQKIDDAVEFFTTYNYGIGSFEDFFAFTVSAGTSAYNMSAYFDDTVQATIDFDTQKGFRFMDGSFGHMNAFGGQYPATYSNYATNSSEGMLLAESNIAMIYGQQWKDQYVRKYKVDYRPASRVMVMTPTPSTSGIGLLTVYRKEKAEQLYNQIHVKNLAVAYCMKLWGGLNLGKYTKEIPGGGTINFREIYDMGIREEEKWEEKIISESEPVDPMMG